MAERNLSVPAELVYNCIADYRQHHPKILPPAFTDFRVEKGGIGAGTEIRFRMKVARSIQAFHSRVDEPEPGYILTETEIERDLVTRFIVEAGGDRCRVGIETRYTQSGLRGLLEAIFAPRAMRRIFEQELAQLEHYALTLMHSGTDG
jgi:hypothetical protein